MDSLFSAYTKKLNDQFKPFSIGSSPFPWHSHFNHRQHSNRPKPDSEPHDLKWQLGELCPVADSSLSVELKITPEFKWLTSVVDPQNNLVFNPRHKYVDPVKSCTVTPHLQLSKETKVNLESLKLYSQLSERTKMCVNFASRKVKFEVKMPRAQSLALPTKLELTVNKKCALVETYFTQSKTVQHQSATAVSPRSLEHY